LSKDITSIHQDIKSLHFKRYNYVPKDNDDALCCQKRHSPPVTGENQPRQEEHGVASCLVGGGTNTKAPLLTWL